MSLIEEAKSWMKLNPKYARFLKNDEVCLRFYSARHPELKINPDFELEQREIHLGSQIFIANYEQKFFEFTLNEGLGDYQGNKFGWKGKYAGVNKEGVHLCLDVGFDLKIITPDDQYLFHRSDIEKAVVNKWVMSAGNRPRLFYLPVDTSAKSFSTENNATLDDF